MKRIEGPWMGYAVAVGATLLAVGVRFGLASWLGDRAPLSLLIPAVIAAAWIGGLGPGLLATGLGAVLGGYFFLGGQQSFAISEPGDWLRLAIFVVEGSFFSLLFQRIGAKRRLLEQEVVERRRSEEESKAQKDLLQTTLTSVGDGMIATDVEGRVTFLNPIAEKLTGWSDADAKGTLLTEVFRIVNEQSGDEVENPALRALREGTIVGLANHTLLISRDGSVRPIDDSAAPIRGGDGESRGAILVFRDVTEQKQAREELRRSEERLRSIVQATPECVKVVGADGRLLLMNAAGLRMIEADGFDSVSGACVFDLIAPEHRKDWVDFNARICAGASERFEFDVVGLKGTRRHMETHAVPVQMPDGAMAHLAVTRDMTERKRAESRLRESEERYRLIGEASHDAIWDWNLRSNEVVWNPGVRTLFGYSEEEVVPTGDWWIERIHPEDRERVSHGIHAVIDGETGSDRWTDEYRFRRADGGYVAVFDRGQVVRDPSGGAMRMVGAMLDLTERNLAAARLREAEERFDFVRRSSGVGFWYCDLPFDVLEWDEIVKAHFHLPPTATVTIETFYDRIHPDDREPTRSAIERSIAERTTYDVDYRTVDPESGAESWIRAIGRTFYDEEGAPRRFDGVTLDVTKRKAADEAIRASESRFRTLVEQARDYAIFMTDLEGRPTSWNEGVARVLGFSEEEFVGIDVVPLIFTPEDIERGVPQSELEEAAETGRASDDRWMRRKEGTRFFAMGSTSALRDSQGQLLGFLKVMRDQTERKRLEDDLRRIAADLSEADRRKNEFLATLAHELRNPLAPIRSGLELMKLSAENPEEVEELRGVMERQALQMVRLIDDLLEISRITQGKLELRRSRVRLSDVIQSAVESVRPLVDEAGHDLSVAIPSEPIFVDADPARLAQVASNLLHNAVKFTPEGGRIALSVRASGGERAARSVAISVRDEGIGIPRELHGRIFDMFAQLDGALERGAKGLGIGLTLVKRLVEMHGGTVEVRSEGTGQGSEFVVTLPLDEATRAEASPKSSETPADETTGKLRVLVVDDNRAAADTLGKIVGKFGEEVSVVYDGQAAIDAAESFRPDVVLMDLGMPRMNGYEAARHIRGQAWGEGVVLVALTGWGQDEDRRRTTEAGFDHHLVKPAEPDEIRRILGKSKRSRS